MNDVLGILGVGRMGAPICRNLVRAGFTVIAFDPASEAQQAVGDAGASSLDSAALVAAEADVLITVLPGPTELEAIMTGPLGALRSLRADRIWLDFTSGDPRVSERIAQEAAALGVTAVGAPMGGGPEAASSRNLSFFVDGPESAIESVRPILHALGSPEGVRIVGTVPGQAQSVKLLANLLWFGQAAAVTESLLLGQALGLDLAVLRDALRTSAGASTFLEGATDALLRGDYLETFALSRCLEELHTLVGLATDHGSPFELSTHVTRLHEEAFEQFGEVDGELLVAKLLEKRAARSLRVFA